MALGEVSPVPDGLMMEDPVAQLAQPVHRSAQTLTVAMTSRHLGQRSMAEEVWPKRLLMFVALITETAPETEVKFGDDAICGGISSAFTQFAQGFVHGCLFTRV